VTFYFKELGNYGRIGNMMFQMAAVIGAAAFCGDNYRFPYLPQLNGLNIPEWSHGGPIGHHVPTWKEPHFHYAPIPKPWTKPQGMLNLHGYFQSEKYFKHCADEVRQVLTPKHRGKLEGYTAIHVRRTDYLTHTGCYSILRRENYYDKAMQILPSDKYMIFSDDLDWCKKEFIGDQFHFSEERDPVKDLGNMIFCSNYIIANSSFSWWGAWLSSHKDKKVVAPAKWFGPKLAPTHNTKDLYPDGWIQI